MNWNVRVPDAIMQESYKKSKQDKKQKGQARIQEFMLEVAPPPESAPDGLKPITSVISKGFINKLKQNRRNILLEVNIRQT